MARFVQFEQDPEMPPGVGTFHREDGTSIYGQDDELAATLAPGLTDPSRGALAQAPVPAGTPLQAAYTSKTLGGPEVPGAFDVREALDAQSPGWAPPPAIKPTPQAAPVPSPTAGQPPTPAPAPEGATPPGGDIPMRYVAASPGGYTPKGQTTTIEDAQPYDPDAAQVRADLSINEQMLRQAQTDRAVAEQEARAQALRAQIPTLKKQADIAEAEERQRQGEYERERGELETLVKDVREKKVNPDAIYEGRDWARVVSALASALGAYGATLGRTENFAQNTIDRAIDRSINAQKAEIDKGNQDVQNTLGILKDKYGSWDQAKSAFKIAASHVAEAEAAEVASTIGTQQAKDAFAQWQIEHVKKRNEEEQNFRNLARGKVKTTVTEDYRAPTAGGMVPDLSALKREAEIAKLRGDITENNARARGGPDDKQVAKLGEKLAETESTMEAFDSTARNIGLQQDPKTGGFSVPPGKDVAGAGVWDATVGKWIPNSDSALASQDLGAVLSAYIKATSGAAATEGEVERLKTQLFGAIPTEASVAHGMSLLRNNLKAQRQTLKAGYGPNAARAVRENRRAVESDERKDAVDAEEY